MEAQLRSLIAAARSGQNEAYQGILAAYGPRLYGYFFRATGSHHDAEDLLSELMLRLVRRLADYDDRGRFEPWLFSIAANLVRDRIRRSKARPATTSLDVDSEEGANMADGLSGPAAPADAGLMQAEIGAVLAAALNKLDESSRQMVLLRHFGELSFKEIAGIFDCPVGTVLARVHRALKALRRTLESYDERE